MSKVSKTDKKTNVGRPVKNIIEPIDDTPENVAAAIMLGEGKKDWDYMKR